MRAKPTSTVSFFRSSFFRAALAMTLASSLVVASLSLLNLRSTQTIAEQQLHDQAHGTSQILARQMVGAIRFSDRTQLEKIFKDVVDNPSNPVLATLATDAEGAVIATYAREGVDTAPLLALGQEAAAKGETVESADGLSLAIPVHSPGGKGVLGYFISSWSAAPTLAAIDASNAFALKIAGAILLLSMLATTFLIRHMISVRLARVNAAMSTIAGGALETEVPETKYKDEIGHIAVSLEAFRQSLVEAETVNRLAQIRGTALNSASTAIMLTNAAHEITYVNEAMEALMHHHAEALRQRTPDFDPARLVGTRADRILEGGTAVAHDMDEGASETLRIEQDLSSGTIAVEVNAVIDAQGRKLGHVAEWHDITAARKNAAIISAIDATQLRAEFNPGGDLRAANAAMCRLLQRDDAELRGQDFAQAIRIEASGELAFDALRGGETVTGRLILATDEQTLMLTGAMAPVHNRAGTLQRIVMIASDMTDIEARETQSRTERERSAAEQMRIVERLRTALRSLAEGDLTQTILEPFPGDYETLRLDYNDATEKLRAAMRGVLENSELIHGESAGISRAAEDLSRRTEQQAATLEETAAALNELTASVKSAADRTLTANEMVTIAKRNTESSGQVVREAVQAMGEISESSNKISKITSVIEEISFQTNLLALNAGVEAARAGEAGRGFAVVASEVRALAQRSSEAAREIAGLISDSADQVKRGVDLVGQAGNALDGIQTSVKEIVTFMSDITASTTEQASGLSEVNTAVLQLDQVTQQNAAMFEETSAASQSLAREADGLNETMGRFRLGVPPAKPAATMGSAKPMTVAETKRPMPSAPAGLATSPKPATAAPLVGHSGHRLSSLAVKPSQSEDDWEDF